MNKKIAQILRITQIDHLKGYQQSIISFLTKCQLSQNLKNGHKAFVNSACTLIYLLYGNNMGVYIGFRLHQATLVFLRKI